MKSKIVTPRTKLTLITNLERDSQEFNWIHELRSNEQSSWWSLHGRAKTRQDTEKVVDNFLPVAQVKGNEKTLRFAYLVHELVDNAQELFIGLITLRTLSVEETQSLPREHHGNTASTLSLELAYMFLPASWGRGLATESVTAVLKTCAAAPASLWTPYQKVIVRAIVNDENGPSQRVMEKCGMDEPEVLEFEGGRFFIAGKWRTKHRLCVYGKEMGGST
ncbi:hypothetical protein ACEQ8H_004724 [Pleosporales sp. CAS-2024a]